jgi:hypothetical protein
MKTEGEVDRRIGSKVIYSWIGSSLTGCKLVPWKHTLKNKNSTDVKRLRFDVVSRSLRATSHTSQSLRGCSPVVLATSTPSQAPNNPAEKAGCMYVRGRGGGRALI